MSAHRHRTVPCWALWTLAALALLVAAPARAGEPERGGIRVERDDGSVVEFPLTGLEITGDVVGDLATVTVVQTYENPFDERIEAVYTFPLPEDAAVYEMAMVIGERRIRAEIQEREEARRTYEEARDEGRSAALLDQERPNVFTQTVANIEPGAPIQVMISYVDQLPFEDGRFHFAMPLVVGPRYVGGEPTGSAASGHGMLADTDRVPDASRITPPVLPEGRRVPYEVDLELRLSAGMKIHDVQSPSHDLVPAWHDETSVTLTLPADQRTPDRDLVMSYALADAVPAVGVASHLDSRGGFFSLSVLPPTEVAPESIRSRELVFVLDTSGSMDGEPLDAARRLMHHALDGMRPGDTFRLVRFATDTGTLADTALAPTPENLERARAWIDGIEASGGTELEAGVAAALDPAADPERLRMVFFVTDGYIGDESSVLAMLAERIGSARLFSVGVGSSVNRYLLDELALAGRGTVAYLDTDDDPTPIVEAFFRRIDSPVLTDLEVDWGTLAVSDVAPAPLADVFAGMPLVLTGRYERAGTGTVTVRGLHGTTPVELVLEVELSGEAEHPALPLVWARRRIALLERRGEYDYGVADTEAEVTKLGLEFGLMTQHTSFVAVDERIVADAADPLRTVQVAVNLPDGVSDALIGVQITPSYVQPGDPEILVQTGPDALAVTAYYPFDLVQQLAFDPITERWASRFLVPRDLADGRYTILVVIEYADGRVEALDVPFEVDARAPRLEAELVGLDASAPRLELDRAVLVRARLLELEPALPDGALGGTVVPDKIKFVRVHLPDGRVVNVSSASDDPLRYDFWFRHRTKLGAGTFEILVEAVDVAGNASFVTLTYEAAESAEAAGL